MSLTALIAFAMLAGSALAGTIAITTTEGTTHEVDYSRNTFRKTGVILSSGDKLDFEQIKTITTDDFEAYERAMLRTSRKAYKDVEVVFTGDENLFAKRMEKLKKQRNRAHAARGAGGILMLVGALAGDRDLVRAGAITYGAGTIARDINTEKVLDAQTQAIVENQEAQKQAADSEEQDLAELEAELREAYGDANVDGLIALIEGDHRRALAFAAAGGASAEPMHQMGSAWLMALIHDDRGNKEDQTALDADFKRIIAVDPETSSVEEARAWLEVLRIDLEDLRKG